MLTPAEALTPPTTPPIKPPMAVPIPGQMHEPIAAPAQAPPVPPTAPAPLQAVRLPNSFPDILPEQSLTVSGMTLTVKAAVAVITFVEAVRERRLRAAAPVSARLPTPSAVFSITFRPTPERMAASMTLLALFCRTAVVARPALSFKVEVMIYCPYPVHCEPGISFIFECQRVILLSKSVFLSFLSKKA